MFKLTLLTLLSLMSYEATAGHAPQRAPVPVVPLPYTVTIQNTSNKALYYVAYESNTPTDGLTIGKTISMPSLAVGTKITVNPSKTLLIFGKKSPSDPNAMALMCSANTNSKTKKIIIRKDVGGNINCIAN